MKEETWFKMLILSTILHFVVICAFSVPIKKSSKRFEASPSYSVNLVGDIGGSGGSKPAGLSESKPAPQKAPAKLSKPTPPQKTKPVLARKEKEIVSLSKKKVPPKEPRTKETPTKEELSRLEDRIREIKRRTEYLDVSRSKGPVAAAGPGGTGSAGYGLSGAGDGGSKALDPAMQRYILGVWEKIKDSWGLPGMASFKKDLSTKVTIKIRKDGRIVDINMEERSGNKIYDESILRVLRSVDPLPPIPASLDMDTIEIGFRFMPGELS